MKRFNTYIFAIALVSLHTYGATAREHLTEAIKEAQETVNRIDSGLEILRVTDLTQTDPQDLFDILDKTVYGTTSDWLTKHRQERYETWHQTEFKKFQRIEPILKYRFRSGLTPSDHVLNRQCIKDKNDLIPLACRLLEERKAKELKAITVMQAYLKRLSKAD